ncbi:MAG: PadR family transcriptional regulator, partial [Burkholderiales bacterium]|nr:PadR family transcriptional regulator [Burkholderiales bacterium]
SAAKLSHEQQLRYLILKAGITFEESRVQWTKEALRILKDGAAAN